MSTVVLSSDPLPQAQSVSVSEGGDVMTIVGYWLSTDTALPFAALIKLTAGPDDVLDITTDPMRSQMNAQLLALGYALP